MKKFVSLLTSMIVTLFVIGCSNPSSSSGGSLGMGGAEDNGTDISDKIVLANANNLWSDKTQQLLTADSLAGYSSLKITVSNSSSADAWWVTLYTAEDWDAVLYEGGTSSETKTLTISDLSTCTNGIYIAGTWDESKSYTITILAYK